MPAWAAGTEATLRHYENQGCDDRGGHVGFGAVLGDPAVGVGAAAAWQYVVQPTVDGAQWPRLNGASTRKWNCLLAAATASNGADNSRTCDVPSSV